MESPTSRKSLVREVIQFASNDRVFGPQVRELEHGATLNSLRDRTIAEFDAEKLLEIFATLGPVDDPSVKSKMNETLLLDCTCAGERFNNCGSRCKCLGPCNWDMSGCGWLWGEPCIGVCSQC